MTTLVHGAAWRVEVDYIELVYYWDERPCPGSMFNSWCAHLSRYVTSHPGQLSLVIPSCVGAVNTNQRAVTPCGRGVKAGILCES